MRQGVRCVFRLRFDHLSSAGHYLKVFLACVCCDERPRYLSDELFSNLVFSDLLSYCE